MSANSKGIESIAPAPKGGSAIKHFLLILALGGAVWVLLLRFFFPGYLDPFVPFHVDHFIYLGDSADGYGLMRYIRYYPRPLGNIIFDLLGRLGTRGMLVPVFALTLVNGALLIRYVERLTGRFVSVITVTCFFVLVFGNTESYSNVKEDILAVVCLSCVLLIFHLWQNYVESGMRWNIGGIIVLALLSSYVKETYFATLVAFFFVQALITAGRRRTAFVLVAANIFIAGLSLFYNAKRSPFVNMNLTSTDAYFQNWSPVSILHSYQHLLKFLIFPVPALVVIAALIIVGRKSRKELCIGLVSLLFVATILLPHTLLPNHLEDQYAWLGAFFLFTPVLLADRFMPKRGLPLVVTAIAAVAICAATLREYILSSRHQGSTSWLRGQEEYQRIFLSSWPIMKNIIMPGEHALVVGPSLPYQPFTIPGYIWKSFGADTQWTVVLPDSFPKTKNLTTEVIHASDVTSLDYDRIFVFSPDARLVGLYSEQEAQAILKEGGFTQFPALPRRQNATPPTASQTEATAAGVVFRADPNPVFARNSKGKTTITWDTGSAVVGDVYVGSARKEKLFASSSKGSQDAPWIQPGSIEFRLYNHNDHSLIAKLTVTMFASDVPTISPSATPISAASP